MALNILIADDAPFIREVLKNIVQNSLGHYVVAEAEDGQQALDLISQYKPDVVFLDVVMPNMNGLEVLKKANEQGSQCQFILCSTLEEEMMVEHLSGLSSYRFLQKPFSKEDVVIILKGIA